MKRFVSALFVALYLHGVLFLSKLPDTPDIPPLPVKEERIRISLHSAIKKEPVVKPQPKKKKKKIQETPQVKEPEIKKVQEPIEIVAEIPQKQMMVEHPPVLLKVRTEKTVRHNSLKSNITDLTSETPPQITKDNIVVSAAVITVKASPLYAENPKPVYPALAHRQNLQGTVILSVLVSKEGHVEKLKIHTGSGHTLLDASAMKSVKSWRFLPGIEADRPVAMEVLVPVHYKLR